jgi:hypothetical protein
MRNLKSNNPHNLDSFRYKRLWEYKSDYPNLLEYYLKLNEDNDEINFVTSEIRLISEYITPFVNGQKTELEQQGFEDINSLMIENYLVSYNKIISFLENRKSELEKESNTIFSKTSLTENLDLSNTSTIENNITIINEPSGEMFSNNGFVLFEYILNEYIKPKNIKGRYEDLSYYYRRLFEDKFIHQRPESFRLWFNEKYEEEFTKIKTKPQTTSSQRKKNYSSALDWFKPQNK